MGRVLQELQNFDDDAGVDADTSAKRFAGFQHASKARDNQDQI